MKRVQKCGICNQVGHNRRNCPNKHLLQSEINEIENDSWNIIDIEYNDSRNDKRYIDIQRTKIKIRRAELEYELNLCLDKKQDKLWFDTQEYCGWDIGHYLMVENKYIALAVAQPGVGKTNLIQYLIFHFKALLRDEEIIIGDRITIATGMSSRDWIDQTKKGTTLLDKNKNEEIYHRDTLHKRIKYLKDNPKLLSDHVFILDECHIGCDKEQTIDNLLNRDLKLTKEIIKKLKIKIIFISATPDIIQAELEKKHEDEWQFCVLKPGIGYRGFEFIRNKKWLYDYDNLKINEKEIFKSNINKYSKPKYHIIRIRGKASENFKKMIKNLCGTENIGIWKDHNEQNKIENFEDILKEEPEKHTFVFIKEFYRASKRLRLTKNIGLIIEPSVNNDVTVTGQNLLARFFGYYDDSELEFAEAPMFICNKECVDTYLEFANNFTYDGIDYKSRKIKENGEIRGNIQSYQNNYTEDISEDGNNNDNIDFIIGIYDTFEEAKNKGNELHLWEDGQKLETFEKHRKNGFYTNNLGDGKGHKICSKNELTKSRSGVGSANGVIRPYYENKSDMNSIKWALIQL